jgi:hypothetical protein
MRSAQPALSFIGVLLAATLASAQPQPQTQPPRPQPQDPTPIPDPKPTITKPGPSPQEPAGSGRLGGSGEIVVSGCLQRGEDTAPETKDSGGISGGYVLKQATAKPDESSPQRSASRPGSKEYRVVTTRDSVKLAEHVGHQVEVKGRVTLQDRAPDRKGTDSSVSSSQPSGSTGVSTVPPATGAPPATAPPVTLTASSIKTIASSCSVPTS